MSRPATCCQARCGEVHTLNLEQSTDGIIVLSPGGRVTHVSEVAKRLATRDPMARHFSEVFQLASHNSSDAMPQSFASEGIQGFLGAESFRRLEVTLTTSASVFLLAIASLQDGGKQAVGSILTLTDITERKRAEEQQSIIAAEQAHRVKNVLAIVQALVTQTLSNCETMDAAKQSISGRLMALANAHDVLIKGGGLR
jgi:HWE histidine kinase